MKFLYPFLHEKREMFSISGTTALNIYLHLSIQQKTSNLDLIVHDNEFFDEFSNDIYQFINDLIKQQDCFPFEVILINLPNQITKIICIKSDKISMKLISITKTYSRLSSRIRTT